MRRMSVEWTVHCVAAGLAVIASPSSVLICGDGLSAFSIQGPTVSLVSLFLILGEQQGALRTSNTNLRYRFHLVLPLPRLSSPSLFSISLFHLFSFSSPSLLHLLFFFSPSPCLRRCSLSSLPLSLSLPSHPFTHRLSRVTTIDSLRIPSPNIPPKHITRDPAGSSPGSSFFHLQGTRIAQAATIQ
jgi:hypothetical protein